MSNKIQPYSLFLSANCSTCFGCYFHPSSRAHTLSTASGTCQTVTANCCIVELLERSSESSTIATGSSYGLTSARCYRYSCVLMMGGENTRKHIQQFPEINKLCNVASSWIYLYIRIFLRYTDPWTLNKTIFLLPKFTCRSFVNTIFLRVVKGRENLTASVLHRNEILCHKLINTTLHKIAKELVQHTFTEWRERQYSSPGLPRFFCSRNTSGFKKQPRILTSSFTVTFFARKDIQI